MFNRDLLLKIAPTLTSGSNFMENLRENLSRYVDNPEISIHDIAEAADISPNTLNCILYGKTKDCYTGSVIALARALGVSVDELVGAETLSRDERECVQILRALPIHIRGTFMWFLRRHQAQLNEIKRGSHTIAVMHPTINQDGDLKINEDCTFIDISQYAETFCRKIFIGLELGVDYYAPTYYPYDTLLIANDRPPRSDETVVLLLSGSIFLAKRGKDPQRKDYYSIRDGKFRVRDDECDEVIGYVVETIHGTGYIDDGRS